MVELRTRDREVSGSNLTYCAAEYGQRTFDSVAKQYNLVYVLANVWYVLRSGT